MEQSRSGVKPRNMEMEELETSARGGERGCCQTAGSERTVGVQAAKPALWHLTKEERDRGGSDHTVDFAVWVRSV